MHAARLWLLFSLAFLVARPLSAQAQADWPAGASPIEIGRRVTERFLHSPHASGGPKFPHIIYPEVCAWYGGLTFAEAANQPDLTAKLVDRFAPLFQLDQASLIPAANHVDNCVFGAVPLEIYRQLRRYPYRVMGLAIADAQWDNPLPDGLTSQTRYWIDDMFMITAVQVEAYRATGDRKYLDRAAREMTAYLEKLQRPNGLFYHAPDVPFYWGRGNGWVAVGMAEMLRSLPSDHPARPAILAGYRRMMATLLRYQTPDGMWRQLIDHPEAWIESSCSGMFADAFITGVKEGWLDQGQYGPAARKAWLTLITYLDANADIREVCAGTNKTNNLQFYLNRPRKVGDMHGQAPVLWCATAWLRTKE